MENALSLGCTGLESRADCNVYKLIYIKQEKKYCTAGKILYLLLLHETTNTIV